MIRENNRIYTLIKRLLVVAYIMISVIYIGYAILTFIKKGEPSPLAGYLPIETFMYGQFPAFCVLIVFAVHERMVNKATTWGFFKIPFRLFALSMVALFICALSIIYTR